MLMEGRQMKEIIIDLKNYMENGTVFKRIAARGIVERDGKYLIIHSKHGDYKFPGGGQKKGETLEETLIREIQEETGYKVIPESVRDGIKIHEKRKGDIDDLMEMESYYFYCQVEEEVGDKNLDDYEKEYDYQVEWMGLEDIIEKNELVENFEKIPWIVRENMVMKELLKNR